MYIRTNLSSFKPNSFIICEFYGEEICVCWEGNRFVIFPYKDEDSTAYLTVYVAPGIIKNVYCFSGRIFMIFQPCGVYKFSRGKEFAILSKNAVGLGSLFYETFTPKGNALYLENKHEKTSNMLFEINSNESMSNYFSFLGMSLEDTDKDLKNILWDETDLIGNTCFIGYKQKLFLLLNNCVKMIYACDKDIVNIVPVKKSGKIAGIIVVTVSNAILILYVKNKKLRFDKEQIGTEITALVAGFCKDYTDNIWIIHSNGSKVFYIKKQLSKGPAQKIKSEEKSYTHFQHHSPNNISCLKNNNELDTISVENIEKVVFPEKEEFIKLEPDMLVGSDVICDKIMEQVQILQTLNENLQKEQQKLYRINLYANMKRTLTYPKITVQNLSNQYFLIAKFQEKLPMNSHVVLSLESKSQRVSCMKQVDSSETSIVLCIPEEIRINVNKVSIDLVTHINEGEPWCVIKNYVNYPKINEQNIKLLSKNKEIFIKNKIELIKSLVNENKVDMKKLIDIKNSVRREINDIFNM
ncbi:uncharacterized protein [Prorops nasuta]|uniref:uncharacterized protein n=1 Tax=Prorops nasuta TaxID=863751 RepID=UPI0034CFC286